MKKLQAALKDTNLQETRNENDTIRIWESYREQALLWRALSLLQVPVTILSLILALALWSSRVNKIIPIREVKPGILNIREIPDVEFIDQSVELVNLIATYQPAVAKRQFSMARELLTEPVLSNFDQDVLGSELRAIEATSRTQLYFIDPSKTKIEKGDNSVTVTLTGDRQKIVAGKEMQGVSTKYSVTMKVIPKNKLNPFGIAISDIRVQDGN